MKKISFVCFNISNIGGAERVVCNLCNELCQRYETHLLTLCGNYEECKYFIDKRIKCFNVGNKNNERIRNIMIKSFMTLKNYFKNNQIDIIFLVGNYVPPSVMAVKFFVGSKFVYCDHGALINEIEKKKITLFRKMAGKLCDKTVVLVERTKKDYEQILKIPSNKIEYIYNHIDDDIYKNSSKCNIFSKNIISVGRISSEKGFDMAVEVAKYVFDKHKDWQWHIYGDGPDYEKIDKKIKEYGLENNFILKGATDYILEKYKDYSICVLPSYREGLPLVLLEAKCNMLPIVSFDCATGPSEIVNDGVDGYLVECYNTKKMAQRICNLIESVDLRKEFSNNSKKNLYKFKKSNILNKWINLIDNLN